MALLAQDTAFSLQVLAGKLKWCEGLGRGGRRRVAQGHTGMPEDPLASRVLASSTIVLKWSSSNQHSFVVRHSSCTSDVVTYGSSWEPRLRAQQPPIFTVPSPASCGRDNHKQQTCKGDRSDFHAVVEGNSLCSDGEETYLSR